MTQREHTDGDSRETVGGLIPGSDGAPAFRCSGPEPSTIPVLIAVPHAGRAYPQVLLDRMRHPQLSALRLEDRHVDQLAQGIAQASGARLLIADAPRAMIDLNREPGDIDETMFVRRPGHAFASSAASSAAGVNSIGRRARGGLGLIPRRLPGLGELWRGLLDPADLEERLSQVHAPYHAALAGELAALRSRWGAALLIDLHSMPPLPDEGGGGGAEFVIGDRFGASCDGELTAAAFHCLAGEARRAAHNRPYAGGYGLARHGHPEEGFNAVQIEVDRASYLDAQLVEPGDGLADVVSVLTRLVRDLADVTALLGARRNQTRWAEAAE